MAKFFGNVNLVMIGRVGANACGYAGASRRCSVCEYSLPVAASVFRSAVDWFALLSEFRASAAYAHYP